MYIVSVKKAYPRGGERLRDDGMINLAGLLQNTVSVLESAESAFVFQVVCQARRV